MENRRHVRSMQIEPLQPTTRANYFERAWSRESGYKLVVNMHVPLESRASSTVIFFLVRKAGRKQRHNEILWENYDKIEHFDGPGNNYTWRRRMFYEGDTPLLHRRRMKKFHGTAITWNVDRRIDEQSRQRRPKEGNSKIPRNIEDIVMTLFRSVSSIKGTTSTGSVLSTTVRSTRSGHASYEFQLPPLIPASCAL